MVLGRSGALVHGFIFESTLTAAVAREGVLERKALLMPDPGLMPPYGWLAFGAVLLSLALIGTCTGRTRARFQGWVYRAQEPVLFWLLVAMYYLAGIGFIRYFFYRINGH